MFQLAATDSNLLGVVAPAILALVFGFRYLKRKQNPAQKPAPASKQKPAAPVAPLMPIHPLVLPPKTARAVAPETTVRTSPIAKVRDLLGPPRRTFAPEIATYLNMTPPKWLESNDELTLQYQNQKRIREQGPVVWATFAQLNRLMFSPGAGDSPGSMVYSLDPWFATHPEELGRIAQELYALKSTDQEDPESATFARMLTNELIRAMRLQVPRRFTGGRVVYHSAMVFARKHLPKGYVSANLMPVWVDPAETGALIMVPAAYWPPSLLTYWDPPEPVKAPPAKN